MSYFHKPKSWSTPYAYNLYNKFIVIIEFSFVSSRDPLWLEQLRCLLSAIDGACEPLSSRSSSMGCRFKCWFKDLFLSSAHVFCKYDGDLLPSMHFFFFFLSSLRFLYFELLKLMPPFLFFRFIPGSIVDIVLWFGSFMCASKFPSDFLSWALYFLGVPLLHSKYDPSPTFSYLYSTTVESLGFTILW